MATLNKVFLIGNLTRDPELRYTPSGTAVGELNLASSQRFTSKTGVQRDDVVYVRITVWGKQAEACGEYLSKGSSLFVEGRLHLDMWETKEGQKRSRLRVIAQRVQFLGRPKGKASNAESSSVKDNAAGHFSDEESSAVEMDGDAVQIESMHDDKPPF